MQLIDIGVNLTHGSFARDREGFIARAAEAGVCQMVLTGTSVEDSETALELCRQFDREGIAVHCRAQAVRAQPAAAGATLVIEQSGTETTLAADAILVAVGRAANVDGLALEAAGIKFSSRGVEINDFLQTSNPRVYAAGDVAGSFQFTHAADAMARACVQNAFFFGRKRLSRLTMPWCTFTEPEIAHVGLYEAEANAKGLEVETYTYKLEEVDRAILDGEDEGFARVHIQKGSDKVLGATIVAAHAGDMIGEFSVLMKAGAGAKTLASTIHPYPTQAEVNKKAVNLWRKAHFTPRTKDLLTKLFAWMRR